MNINYLAPYEFCYPPNSIDFMSGIRSKIGAAEVRIQLAIF